MLFQSTQRLQNIAYLKKAIKQENPNTVSCDAYQIDIYRQEDGRWVKEGKMAASLRETDEAIAMASYYQPKPRLRHIVSPCTRSMGTASLLAPKCADAKQFEEVWKARYVEHAHGNGAQLQASE